MADASYIKQHRPRFYEFTLAIEVLAFIAIIISIPFDFLAGIGLVATVPLAFFIVLHRRYIRLIKAGQPLERRAYRAYSLVTILSGAACAFGFWMFWEVSHGIDVQTTPSAPMLFMSVAGSPLITLAIIYVPHRWNKLFS